MIASALESGAVVQRVRVVFAKGDQVRYISHLDLLRVWERVLRRARVPMAWSQGFNPRPRLFFAAALPVGVTGSAEMLDLMLASPVELPVLQHLIGDQLPPGLHLCALEDVPLTLPSLPSRVVAAVYEVIFAESASVDDLQCRVDSLLAAPSLPRSRQRPDGVRSYDLRPLVQSLWISKTDAGRTVLHMRLQMDQQGTGRPDEVLAELGLWGSAQSIERVELVLQ